MIRSKGTLRDVALKDVVQEFTADSWNGWTSSGPGSAGYSLRAAAAYDVMVDRHVWVSAAVSKLGNAVARLPLKTFVADDLNRPEAPADNPYAALIRKPSPVIPPYLFWLWTICTTYTYGEAFLIKVRDAGGRPYALKPTHPLRMIEPNAIAGDGRSWSYSRPDGQRERIDRRDFVHLRLWNPRGELTPGGRGHSPLEPLRATLEHEWNALRAQSALWNNGARPSVFLRHPKRLSKGAHERLRADWAGNYSGVDNWALPAILEEGLQAEKVTLSAEELAYIDSRKLNREEVCGAYDIPPPVLHILDRATFSNITEQMRSMYRDTMAPRLGWLESTLELELRDGTFGQDGEPDFGAQVYAEFVLDGVLRGDFEQRVQAYSHGIQNGWLQPAEVRRMENLPFVDGSEVLLINGTLRPIDEAGNAGDASGPGAEEPAVEAIRGILGRIGRLEAELACADLRVDSIAGDLPVGDPAREILATELRDAAAHGETVADLRTRLKGWTTR